MKRRSERIPIFDDDPLWYKDAVIYELHVRSFLDSDADGVGDFLGLIEKLDYLDDLGVTALRLHPLTDLDAREMISSIKMAKLFEGFRGSPPSDTQALEDLLLRLSAMVEDIPQIAELDFNPVRVMPQGEGYWIVDARIMIK